MFRESLAIYRTASRHLERLIMISLVMLVIASSLLGWLAYRAYLKPVKGELAVAKVRADRHARLASIGALAAGIAHEIRNPLTAIKARVFALRELVKGDASAIKQATIIDEELDRMEHLLRDFLDYARPAEPEFDDGDVRGFLSELRALLAPEFEERNIALRLDAPSNLIGRFDRHQLRQVILNLIKNASQAVPEDGEGEIIVSAQQTDENQIEIAVTDNGHGIPEAYQSEIFTPFFSKKHGGTGLGLPICRNIVKKHGSDLKFETSEESGTRFYFRLQTTPPIEE